MQRVLAVDDDPASLRLLQTLLSQAGWEVATAPDGTSGLGLAESGLPDVVILDLRLPGLDGLDVLSRLQEQQPLLPVIIVTAFGELRTALEATRRGAFDYLTKPIDADQLLLACRRALETRALRLEVEELRHSAAAGGPLTLSMGSGPRIARLVEQVRGVASSDFSVLLSGEKGTGKDLVARAVHRQSRRAAKPFVAVSCGALPQALADSELFARDAGNDKRKQSDLRQADGGTLFLDQVDQLPHALQAGLLRLLAERAAPAAQAPASTIDVRIVAATSRDLLTLAHQGQFRPDLYYRLAQLSIKLPPLRERPEDVPELAQRFLSELSIELRRPTLSIARDALATLTRHDWPGNVGELKHVMRQAVLETHNVTLRADTVNKLIREADKHARHEPEQHSIPSLRDAVRAATREAERKVISDALRRTSGNQSRAARLLRTDYKTLYLKLKQLGLRSSDFSG